MQFFSDKEKDMQGDLTVSAAEYRALQRMVDCLVYLADEGNKDAINAVNAATDIFEEALDILDY